MEFRDFVWRFEVLLTEPRFHVIFRYKNINNYAKKYYYILKLLQFSLINILFANKK